MEEFIKKLLEGKKSTTSEHMKKHHPGAPEGIEYMDWHPDMGEPKFETLPAKPEDTNLKIELLRLKKNKKVNK